MAVKVAGTWRTVANTKAKVGGVWKATASGWVRQSGVWREFVANTLSLGYSSTAFTIGSSGQTRAATVSGGYTSQAKTFALTSGTLPAGVTLNASTGTLTGPKSWNSPAVGPVGQLPSYPRLISSIEMSDGSTIIAGSFGSTTMVFGSTTLTRTGTDSNLFIAKISNTGSWLWAITNTGTGTPEAGQTIVETPDGGVMVVGAYSGAALTLGSTTLPSPTGSKVYVTKVSSSGSFQWALAATGSGSIAFPSQRHSRLSLSSDGGLVIGGTFSGGTITFGSTTLSMSSSGSFFAAKVSSTGSWVWAVANTSSGAGGVYISAVTGANDGGLFLYGVFTTTTMTVGNTVSKTSSFSSQAYVARVSNSGALQWILSNTGTGYVGYTGLVEDASGNVYVGGFVQGSAITFGSTNIPVVNSTTNTAFFIKTSSTGSLLWAIYVPGAAGFTSVEIYLFPDGNISCVGNLANAGSNTFGSTTLTYPSYANVVVAKLSTSGSWLWATMSGGPNNASFIRYRMGINGDIFVLGSFSSGTISFGSFSLTNSLSNSQLWVAGMRSSGTWFGAVATTGTASISAVSSIFPTASGGVVASGYYSANNTSVTFGGTTLTSTPGFANPYCVKVIPTVAWGSTNQSALGFPATITVSATDSSGTANTSPTITAV